MFNVAFAKSKSETFLSQKKKKKMQVGVMIETLHGSTRKIWTKWAFALFRQIN